MLSKNLLFAKVNKIPVLNKPKAAEEILTLVEKYSFFDKYRHTRMIPLMTKNGDIFAKGANNLRSGEFNWVEYAPKIIIDWFEDHVFPWLERKSRIMALITKPNDSNYEHIDCDPDELHTMQHKLRIVLKGRTDTLYWLTKNGKINAPDVDELFIMDGSWPHGMHNFTNETKVTLALGAPWTGKNDYGTDITYLQYKSDYELPDDVHKYFKN